MNRVLFFSGIDITVFHWQGRHFAGRYTFHTNEQGYEEFSKYLDTIGSGSIKILVDVIEEDFVKEKIPHVGKNDQRAIVERYINRHYRNSQDYYTYKIVGREDIGRKDDIVLYSVITKPEIFSKWFKLIELKNIPVVGMWSLPLISDEILKKVSKESGNVLLVSQQVSSHIRQSFYRNGKFEISRNAIINLDEMPLGQYITEEVEQTSRFLANQRFIGFDEVINIHVICAEKDQEVARKLCGSTPLKVFHFHSIEKLKPELDCQDVTGDLSDGIFSLQCRSKNHITSQYGSVSLFKYYYKMFINNSIKAVNAIAIVTSLLFILNYVIQAQVEKSEAELLNLKKQAMQEKYLVEYQNREAELSRARAIQSSVLFHDRIESLRRISPQKFMNRLSRYLNDSGVSSITITRLEWSSQQKTSARQTRQKVAAMIDLTSMNTIRHFAKVKGHIGNRNESFDQSVKKVNSLINALNKYKNLEKLDIIKMPFDIRPDSKLTHSHSYGASNGADNDQLRAFEFHMLIRGEGNV